MFWDTAETMYVGGSGTSPPDDVLKVDISQPDAPDRCLGARHLVHDLALRFGGRGAPSSLQVAARY